MKYINSKKGFTLIEMVVSLAIFSLVMVVAMGAFLKITEVNKKAQNIKNAMNNVNFTLEAMSRELRTGAEYEVSSDGKQITFIGRYLPAGDPIYYSYRKNGNFIQRGTSPTKPVNTFSDSTSSSVRVSELLFIRTATDEYPRVNILIRGEAGVTESQKTSFDIQTTVSQRLKD